MNILAENSWIVQTAKRRAQKQAAIRFTRYVTPATELQPVPLDQ